MNPILALLLSAVVKGTDMEPGIVALIKLASGLALAADDHSAIGRAMELAHRRLDAGMRPSQPPPPPKPDPLTPPGSTVPASSGPILPAGVTLGRGSVG